MNTRVPTRYPIPSHLLPAGLGLRYFLLPSKSRGRVYLEREVFWFQKSRRVFDERFTGWQRSVYLLSGEFELHFTSWSTYARTHAHSQSINQITLHKGSTAATIPVATRHHHSFNAASTHPRHLQVRHTSKQEMSSRPSYTSPPLSPLGKGVNSRSDPVTHSVHIEKHEVRCTPREAELYFLMGFKRVGCCGGGKEGGGVGGLG